MTSRTRALVIALLAVTLGVGSMRLVRAVTWFSQHGLQADFSAYYIAGKSLNLGLSPYLNHVAEDASLWDGMNLWRPSRFLYPPLAALPFCALAALPYDQAKTVWIGMTFALAAGALLLAMRLTGRSLLAFLAASVWLVVGWPFLIEIERGQIDLLTLVFVLGATLVQRRPGRGRALLAGSLWALAILFKLHVVLALPFLALRRRWDVLTGFLLAGAGLLALSMATLPMPTHDYVTEALPRMIRYGIEPPPGTQLPDAVLRPLFRGHPENVAHTHGHTYVRFAFPFEDHASLVWALAGEKAAYPGLLSLLVTGVMVGAVAVGRRSKRVDGFAQAPVRSSQQRGGDDLVWLVLALCCVLLAAPLTWPMNAVWLSAAVFALLTPDGTGRSSPGFSTAIGMAGLVLVAMPDRHAWPWPTWLYGLSSHKYVLGELAIALAMLHRLRRTARLPAAAGAVATTSTATATE